MLSNLPPNSRSPGSAIPTTACHADDVPAFLEKMHATVTELAQSSFPRRRRWKMRRPQQEYTPAVGARKSLASKDHIISMIDGKPYKTLRRHLSGHGLTPEQYRERYNLKADYPMVAETYSAARREMAHEDRARTERSASEGRDCCSAPAASQSARPGRPKFKLNLRAPPGHRPGGRISPALTRL